MKEIIATADAPSALGPYAQGIKVNDMIFASGQLPVNPKTNEMVAGGITEQTEQVLLNLRAVLEEGEATLDDIVKVNIYMIDLEDFDAMNAVYKLFFPNTETSTNLLPARSTVQVSRLPRDAQIEMEAIAVITHSRYEPELY